MACYNSPILLGFEDEIVTDKNKHLINFSTNKIGGRPDIPSTIKWDTPRCSLCQLPKPLVVQIYAPLPNSLHHRTLYVFACINPKCWNRSESWSCFRVQSVDSPSEESTPRVAKTSALMWCEDADDWGDDNNANENEENGNIINPEKISDEDEESYSYDDSLESNFDSLTVNDKNANNGGLAQHRNRGGAAGRQKSPVASAEIEGDEGEIISIESPTCPPPKDMRAFLNEVSPLPSDIIDSLQKGPSVEFTSSFMNVYEESDSDKYKDFHVKQLMLEYQKRENVKLEDMDIEDGDKGGKESYEKGVPAHGDAFTHSYINRIRKNPGQLLRYSRGNDRPLLLHRLQEPVKKCPYCQQDREFEFQILSTIIPILRLVTDEKPCTRLDFGTALIYTCSKGCWTSENEVREELVIVQKEVY